MQRIYVNITSKHTHALFGSQPLPLPLSHQVVVTGFRAKFNRKAQNPSGKHPPCRCLVPSPAPRLLQGLFLCSKRSFLWRSWSFFPLLFSRTRLFESPSKSSNTDYFSMQMRLIFQGKRKNVDHVRDAQKIAPPTRGSPVHFSMTRFPSFLMWVYCTSWNSGFENLDRLRCCAPTCPFIPSSLSRSHRSCRS